MEHLGNITLYNADCMDIMRELPDKAFDLAIVDPPYGIKISKADRIGKRKNAKIYTEYMPKKWDYNIPTKDYFNELLRVSRNHIIWGANYFTENISMIDDSWIVWDKKQPEGLSFSMGELAICSIKKPLLIYRRLHDGNRVSNNSRKVVSKIHPTQKPVDLYKWLLSRFAKEGDTILDTHLGSGSSAIAAHDGGFKFTGIELDPDYYKAARQRIINHQAQGRLAIRV